MGMWITGMSDLRCATILGNNAVNEGDPLGLMTLAEAAIGTTVIFGIGAVQYARMSREQKRATREAMRKLLDLILNENTEEGEECDDKKHSPDQETLNDLIDEETLGGRKP